MDNLPPPPRDLDDQEESVRIAVKALGDMRKSGGRGDGASALQLFERTKFQCTFQPSFEKPSSFNNTPIHVFALPYIFNPKISNPVHYQHIVSICSTRGDGQLWCIRVPHVKFSSCWLCSARV